MPENPRILLIGGGNMGRSLAGGLVRSGWKADDITVSDPDPRAHQALAAGLGLTRLYYENSLAYSKSSPDVVLFATKPDRLSTTATELAPWMVVDRPLLVSVAAGARADDLARWTGGHCPVARAMPNTPALVGAGMSVLYARADVDGARRTLAGRIMEGVGKILWVEDESLMDVATAVSGSGPAYFFLFLRAMVEAARHMGLDEDQSRLLVLETARGARELAVSSEDSLDELCRKVTSRGGTTEAALNVLEMAGFRELVRDAMEAARNRAAEMGDEHARA